MARGRPLALRCEFGAIHTSVFLHGCSSGVRVGPTAGNPVEVRIGPRRNTSSANRAFARPKCAIVCIMML